MCNSVFSAREAKLNVEEFRIVNKLISSTLKEASSQGKTKHVFVFYKNSDSLEIALRILRKAGYSVFTKTKEGSLAAYVTAEW